MRYGPGILIGGGILILASLAESMPTNISTKNVIKATLNADQTAIKTSLRSIGITLGFAFVGILVATILGLMELSLMGGTVIFLVDGRRDKRHPQIQHHGKNWYW